MLGKEYMIPANYLSPRGREEPDHYDVKLGIGLFIFLPDFGGFTRDNWRNPFDTDRITVERLGPGDTDAKGKGKGGPYPGSYGDTRARFANLKPVLEDKASLNMYGLEGYRQKGPASDVYWVGSRSNGEFFFFQSSVAPGQTPPDWIRHPLCAVRYYSEAERLFIAYSYSMVHLPKWKEIDDGIWSKVHSWEDRARSNRRSSLAARNASSVSANSVVVWRTEHDLCRVSGDQPLARSMIHTRRPADAMRNRQAERDPA
jgi:hypothetical protein